MLLCSDQSISTSSERSDLTKVSLQVQHGNANNNDIHCLVGHRGPKHSIFLDQIPMYMYGYLLGLKSQMSCVSVENPKLVPINQMKNSTNCLVILLKSQLLIFKVK